jgi:hypothetical protein
MINSNFDKEKEIKSSKRGYADLVAYGKPLYL